MNDFIRRLKAWLNRVDRGASAVEYALIVGLIAALVGGAIYVLGTRVNYLFDRACDNVVAQQDTQQCGQRNPG